LVLVDLTTVNNSCGKLLHVLPFETDDNSTRNSALFRLMIRPTHLSVDGYITLLLTLIGEIFGGGKFSCYIEHISTYL